MADGASTKREAGKVHPTFQRPKRVMESWMDIPKYTICRRSSKISGFRPQNSLDVSMEASRYLANTWGRLSFGKHLSFSAKGLLNAWIEPQSSRGLSLSVDPTDARGPPDLVDVVAVDIF